MNRLLRLGMAWALLMGFAVTALLPTGRAEAANWPAWRGDGTGISTETGIATQWDAETNIVWRTALPGEGHSSPVVWDNRVFITAAAEEGAMRHVLCLDASDGRVLWQKDLAPAEETKTYPKTGFAPATAATDGQRVFVFFDSPGLVALDMDGNVLWQRDLGPFRHPYSIASSPLLCDGMVIMLCDHMRDSFIAAYDAATGEERWRTPRATRPHSSSPIVIEAGGVKQIVTVGKRVAAYAAAGGEELWSCDGMKPYVTPSPIFADGLVYAVSGRNGPTMGIDPTGRGDVTETHVRVFYPSGGPYVPSPVAYPHLLIPGDNGALRCLDAEGRLIAEALLGDHFSASPVAADGKLYWTSEKGRTYVVDTSGLRSGTPSLRLQYVNPLNEKVLASPAIANGRVYIRTDRHLYCIAGNAKPASPAILAKDDLSDLSIEQLIAMYEENKGPEAEIEKVSRRLESVSAIGRRRGPEVVPFLAVAARDHNDVGEEAVKQLGLYGEEAVPALLDLLNRRPTGRLYLILVPAEHLGRMGVADALPRLAELAAYKEPLVRIAMLKAMADIALAHPDRAEDAVPALIASLDDRQGVVKRAGVEGLARLEGSLGERRGMVVVRLRELTAGTNPVVADATRKALDAIEGSVEARRRDEALYGTQRPAPIVAYLRAGPIHLKFQDGELRYLNVGGKEIVRRVYFALRDRRFDTIMPEFRMIRLRQREDSFDIDMAATCKSADTDFSWRGIVQGTREGRITFTVVGKPNVDFQSPRIGLNVLYGAESLAGQAYELSGLSGETFFDEAPGFAEALFPESVSPVLLADKQSYRTLAFRTPEGMEVVTSLLLTHFGMEDQRLFGDSSYKAFSGIPYQYRDVKAGQLGGQTLVVEVRNPVPVPVPANSLARGGGEPVAVRLGGPVEGSKMPLFVASDPALSRQSFHRYIQPNRREQFAGLEKLVVAYTPAMHQPDEDTLMENPPSIFDQAKALRAVAEKATLRFDPIKIDCPFHAERDLRNRGLFAAAWSVRAAKYLALAAVEEAAFDVGPGSATLVQQHMAGFAGRSLLETGIGPHDVLDALAVQDSDRRVVWIVNKTDRPQTARVEGWAPDGKLALQRLTASSAGASALPQPAAAALDEGVLALALEPYEVAIVTERRD